MIRYSLTQSELDICTYVGKYRNHITSAQGTERKQDASLDGLQMSINGVITEYAVAKALNLHFDVDCTFRKFGADLVTHKGRTVDVKSTMTHGGNLNAVFWSEQKGADIFILTEILASAVGIVGWIPREQFLVPAYVKDVGNGEFYSMPQSKLLPIDDFIKLKTLQQGR